MDSSWVLRYYFRGLWVFLQLCTCLKLSHPVTGPTSGGLQEYGYVSEGESFTIADPHEVWSSDFWGIGEPKLTSVPNRYGMMLSRYNIWLVAWSGEVLFCQQLDTVLLPHYISVWQVWILEMIGTGKVEKGAVWVAVRIPDGHVSGHANQARIQRFPLKDAERCVYSSDAWEPSSRIWDKGQVIWSSMNQISLGFSWKVEDYWYWYWARWSASQPKWDFGILNGLRRSSVARCHKSRCIQTCQNKTCQNWRFLVTDLKFLWDRRKMDGRQSTSFCFPMWYHGPLNRV